jgi:hypothetical protein
MVGLEASEFQVAREKTEESIIIIERSEKMIIWYTWARVYTVKCNKYSNL